MLTLERERNKLQLYNMFRDKRKNLSDTDKRSLMRTINGLTDYGNDFPLYRAGNLTDVPNTVITGLCHILKEHGYSVYLPREADRYNEISTYCIQETWNSCLKSIFEHTQFVSMSRLMPVQPSSDTRPLSDIYFEALTKLEAEGSVQQIITLLRQAEAIKITHMLFVKMPNLAVVATFEKRSSAHKLMSYAIDHEGKKTFTDMRPRMNERTINKLAKQSTKKLNKMNLAQHQKTNNPYPILKQNYNFGYHQIPQIMETESILNTPISQLRPSLNIQQDDFFVVPTKKPSKILPSIENLLPTIKYPIGPFNSFMNHMIFD